MKFGGNALRNAFAQRLAGKFGGGIMPGMPRPVNQQKKDEPKPEINNNKDMVKLMENLPIKKKDKKKTSKKNFSE